MIAELIGNIFTSSLAGGATGIIGVIIQKWFEVKKTQNDLELAKLQIAAAREQRKMDQAHEVDMAKLGAESAERRAQIEASQKEAEIAERSYQVSMEQSDKATYQPSVAGAGPLVRGMMGLVDFLRGIIRPGATIYLLWLLTVVFWWVQELYNKAGVQMTPAEIKQLANDCVGTIFYLAVSTLMWWFGLRPSGGPRR